jgi:hypothetical protein
MVVTPARNLDSSSLSALLYLLVGGQELEDGGDVSKKAGLQQLVRLVQHHQPHRVRAQDSFAQQLQSSVEDP